MSNSTSFTIHIVAKSGDRYDGVFKIHRRLSHRQLLQQDQLRRELSGPTGGAPSGFSSSLASALAMIRVRVIEAPEWWTKSGNGLDLLDIEPIEAIATEINRIDEEIDKEMAEKAEKALAEIKPV